MARKEIAITLGVENGRDAGKRFVIEEMPALKAERWANRAILAISNAGASQDYAGGGWASLAVFGFKALFGIKESIALELTDELLACVKIKMSEEVIRPLLPDGGDIEEIATLWRLRAEAFAIHAGFTTAEIRSMLISAAKSIQSATSENTPTSREPLAPSSPPESQALQS